MPIAICQSRNILVRSWSANLVPVFGLKNKYCTSSLAENNSTNKGHAVSVHKVMMSVSSVVNGTMISLLGAECPYAATPLVAFLWWGHTSSMAVAVQAVPLLPLLPPTAAAAAAAAAVAAGFLTVMSLLPLQLVF
jgi:hypothetical protein